MTTLLILQFVIPLVLLGWLGFARTSTRATWALKAVLVGGYLTAVALAGVWLALPLHLPAPQRDREHMAGNHVLLACGDVEVLLGHFQQGSVRVREGEMVDAGQEVGRVGNTGNTDEPHLHIHAQRPGPPDAPLGGDPLPVRLGGRYLARNALVRGG